MTRTTAQWPVWFSRTPEKLPGLPSLVVVFLLSTILWLPTAKAQGVPPDLASMAKELFVQSKAELKSSTGDPKQDAVRRRARKILKEAGIRYWAREEVRAGSTKKKPRKHTMTVGDNDDQLDITWDPEKNSFEIRIKASETTKGAGDGFDLRLNGDVLLSPQTGGDKAVLSVRPRDQAISVLTDKDLRRLLGEVFGKWRSGDGGVWEISAPGSGGKAERPSGSPEDRIAELRRQIEKVRTEKMHRWVNTITGEAVLQEPDKFRKLKEPFEYDRGGEQEIARLKKSIEELSTTNKPLPIVANDPVGMNKMRASGDAQSLNIQVTNKDGYSWTYDTALMLNGRITASRTLRNVKDAPKMPPYMMRQAIASFSPPEWIELEVGVDVATKQVGLAGQRWRMYYDHVGNSLSGGKRTVVSIHTPWSRDLQLERELSGKLLFVRSHNGIFTEVEGDLPYGEPLHVEVRFNNDQHGLQKRVLLSWKDRETWIDVDRTQADQRIYRSAAFFLEAPPGLRPE